jgi:predicted DNA-binding protein
MTSARARNFHLPLSEGLYDRLRDVAQKRGRPATAIARQALETWLAQQRRMELHESIAEYALREGGSSADLDRELEEAGLESLRKNE